MNDKESSVSDTGVPAAGRGYKFHPPLLPASSIWRYRLISDVLADTQYSAVVIQGPAGHGKSTLMRQLFDRSQKVGAGVSWLTFDEGDNDISRFNTHLTNLVSNAVFLESPGQGDVTGDAQGNSAVENILRLFEATKNPVALFLDEFQCIDELVNLSLLNTLVERCPPNITFYIGSRSVPSLVRGRLMISGRIKWVTPEQLRFTSEEVLAFLNARGLDVTETEAQAFRDQTGGWPAVLQLLQLALRGGKVDRYTLLRWVKGCEHELTDYLALNVMLDQPLERQRFLMRTSVLNRLCAPLCEALTGQKDSQKILQELVSEGLFTSALDFEQDWFKYHSVFSRYLKTRLEAEDASEVLRIHREAAAWFSENGYPEDAVRHAVEAEEYDLAADLLDEYIPDLILGARLQSVDQLCSLIPDAVFRQRPLICWRRIWAQMFLGQQPRARQTLKSLEQCWQGKDEDIGGFSTSLKLLQWSWGLLADDPVQFAKGVDTISITLDDIDKFRCFEMNVVANLRAIHQLQVGNLTGSREWALLGESLGSRGEAAFSRAYAISIIAYAMIQEGHLSQAIEKLRSALGDAELKIQGSFATASISAIYGFALYESGNYYEAESHLRDTIEMISQTSLLDWLISAYLSLARASLLTEGESLDCGDIIDTAEKNGLVGGLPRMVRVMRQERIRLALVNGNCSEAKLIDDIVAVPGEIDIPEGSIHLAQWCDDDVVHRARMHICCADPEDALKILVPQIAQAESMGWVRRSIKLLILAGLARLALGDELHARRSVLRAVELAYPENYISLFIEEGPSCFTILGDIRESGKQRHEDPVSRFIQDVLKLGGYVAETGIEPTQTQAGTDQLTKREMDILRLVVSGATNTEIGDSLFVSYNTVKFHMKNLYAKMGANNRVNLTQIARQLNLV
jgi:LuxR family transcriptional regulator, maltose regulon positive regulatory protein